jgi:hypothetical protein
MDETPKLYFNPGEIFHKAISIEYYYRIEKSPNRRKGAVAVMRGLYPRPISCWRVLFLAAS